MQWQGETQRLRDDHAAAMQAAEGRVGAAVAEAKAGAAYVDLARALGRLWRVDADASPAAFLDAVYRAAEE